MKTYELEKIIDYYTSIREKEDFLYILKRDNDCKITSENNNISFNLKNIFSKKDIINLLEKDLEKLRAESKNYLNSYEEIEILFRNDGFSYVKDVFLKIKELDSSIYNIIDNKKILFDFNEEQIEINDMDLKIDFITMIKKESDNLKKDLNKIINIENWNDESYSLFIDVNSFIKLNSSNYINWKKENVDKERYNIVNEI